MKKALLEEKMMSAAVAVETEGISREVSDKLFSILKDWSRDGLDGMDSFRYEMFARRLVAAEYGRPDAVEWAQSWYNNVLAEERRIVEGEKRQAKVLAARKEISRAEFKAGRCGNPYYQAFLDTVEHPGLLETNAPYFAWISPLISKFEKVRGVDYLPGPERKTLWLKFLHEERDANLAPRLKAKKGEACE